MKITVVIAILLMFAVFHNGRVCAEPAIGTATIEEGTGTAPLLNSIRNLIDGAIDKARNTGNYLLFKSGTELKSIVNTWEKANADLTDKTFQELDKPQRKFLTDATISAEKMNQNAVRQKEAATKIAELASQALADDGIFKGRLALLQYSPRIAYPGMSKIVYFTIRGINFDKTNPRITLPNGKPASRVSLSNQEAVFSLPSSHFKFEPLKAGFANLKLSYVNPKKKRERTDITILQLPQKIGDFRLQIKTKDTMRDVWEGMRQFYWSGRNESKVLSQGPHDNGWKMIVSSLRQGRVWGDAGKGCFVASNNEQGFAIEVRIGAVKAGVSPNAPGYQYCEWHWKEYFERQVINEQPPIRGQITWSKETSIAIPSNTEGMILRVKTWDDIERAITSSQSEPFFRVVKSGKFLVIKPQIPADLNEL